MNKRVIGTLEQQYRATLDSLGDAIFVIDNNFKIILTNTALELWLSDLGLQTEILDLELHEAIPFFSDRIYYEYHQVFRTGATHVAIESIEINNETYFLETRKIPIIFYNGIITQIVTVIRDITERKQAEEALRKSEEKYRTILENIEDGYFEIDLDGKITFLNNSLTFILGYSQTELLGMNYKLFMREDIYENVQKTLNSTHMLEKSSHVHVWEITRKDGKKIHVEASISLMIDSEGKNIGMRGIIRDISKREQIEKSLQQRLMTEHVLSEISTRFVTISSIEVAINRSLADIGDLLVVDRVSLYLFDETRAYLSMANEWCDKGIAPIMDKSQNLPLDDFSWILERLKGTHVVIIENFKELPINMSSKEEYLLVRDIKSLLILPVHAGIELVGFIELDHTIESYEWHEQDIAPLRVCTEILGNALSRKRSEDDLLWMNKLLKDKVDTKIRELHEESQKVELIIDSISHGILVLDPDGVLILANKQFKEYFNTINPHHQFLPPSWNFAMSSGNIFFDTISKLFLGKKPTQKIIQPIPGLHLQLSTEVGFPAIGLGALIEVRDVTPFIEFDNLRKRFMSSVSHELRTPISVITHSINNMRKFGDKLTEERKDRLIEAIERNSRVLSELIEDLLLFSRIDEKRIDLKYTRFDFHSLVNDVVSQMVPRLKTRNTEVDTFNVEENVTIVGDRSKIAQILRILLDNAYKYSEENSLIKINVFNHYKGLYNSESKDGVLVQVIDQGIGIKEKDIPLLFERFFRSEEVEAIPGTGLGLAIAKELTLLHQGEIFVESIYGEGTTFSVFLPHLEINHKKSDNKSTSYY
ncbi:MAG: PAS domain S-box protein [Candidatus Hodarchaeota archaeon]